MSDLISRQAAIDALSMMQGIVAENGVRKGISMAWQQIKDLPSAEQPEKEIYSTMPEKEFEEWLYNHGICHPDIHEPIPCKVVPLLIDDAINELPAVKPEQRWIPVTERLPSKEERKEWIDKNLGGIGYLYPCLVTRYSSINPDRTKNNPYVAKHYYDGEDFVNNGEEVCSEYIIAWMPLPDPYQEEPT